MLWQGPHGIPIRNVCYDNADYRFSFVMMFTGTDGDLSSPPLPPAVSLLPFLAYCRARN